MKSIYLLLYNASEGVLELRAQDYASNWMSAVAILDDDTYLGAENGYNLFTVRKNSAAASDDDRRRLEVGQVQLWWCLLLNTRERQLCIWAAGVVVPRGGQSRRCYPITRLIRSAASWVKLASGGSPVKCFVRLLHADELRQSIIQDHDSSALDDRLECKFSWKLWRTGEQAAWRWFQA